MPFELLHVEVLSLEGRIQTLEQVSKLNVCLEDGSWIGILPGHAPLIAATRDGTLRYVSQGEEKSLDVNAGILTLSENQVSFLTTY